jgi:hypothetical protein
VQDGTGIATRHRSARNLVSLEAGSIRSSVSGLSFGKSRVKVRIALGIFGHRPLLDVGLRGFRQFHTDVNLASDSIRKRLGWRSLPEQISRGCNCVS